MKTQNVKYVEISKTKYVNMSTNVVSGVVSTGMSAFGIWHQ